jgi:hypothetical protein
MFEWLGERIQKSIEWLSQQLKLFIDGIIDAVLGIWNALSAWVAAQWQTMVAWIVSILPPANPIIDNFIDRIVGIWQDFWSFIQLTGYFMHFPTLVAVLTIIISVEVVLIGIQIYLFIKRLIPVA